MSLLKRTALLLVALTMLVSVIPAAAVSAAMPQTGTAQGVLAAPQGGPSPATGKAANVSAAEGAVVRPGAAPTLDLTLDYRSILGISKATEKALTDRLRQTLRDYLLECDVSDLGIKVDLTSDRKVSAFWALMTSALYQPYDTCMYDFGTYSWDYNTKDYTVTKIKLNNDGYQFSREYYYTMLTRSHTAAEKLLTGIKGNKSLTDVQKALLLHDRLAAWCEYDYDDYLTDTLPHISYTALGILANQLGVCQGYAEAYDYLLEQVGIESRVIQSADINHTWNAVTINGKEYYVDVTWDDPNWDRFGHVKHDNFLISLSELRNTGHNANDYFRLPQIDTYDNWFWKESYSEFQLIGTNGIYYLDNVDDSGFNTAPYEATLMQWTPENSLKARCNIISDVSWTASNGGIWRGNYSTLSSHNGILYFSTAKNVWYYNPETNAVGKQFYLQDANDKRNFFGFTIENGRAYLNLFHTFPTDQASFESYRSYYDFKEVSSVTLTQKPQKTTYVKGDAFEGTGLKLTVSYTDGTKETVTTGYTVEDWDSIKNTAGTKTVYVTFRGKQVSFTVKIIDKITVPVPSVTVGKTCLALSWKDNSAVDRYDILRCEYKDGKQTDWITVGSSTGSTYNDKSAKSGHHYAYSLAAFVQGTFTYGDPPQKYTTYLSAPKFSTENGVSGMSISWKKVSGTSSYLVRRSYKKSGKWSSWSTIKTTKSLSYTDTSAKSGTVYRYAVIAQNSSSKSSYYTGDEIRRLSAPSLTVSNNSSGIYVDWGAVTGATSYKVYYRSASGSKWSGWSTLASTKSSSYTFKKAKAGYNYQFRVRAFNGDDVGMYKVSSSLKRLTTITASAKKSGSTIKVSWKKVTGAKTYTVYRRVNGKTKWDKLSSTSKLTYTDKSAKRGTYYQYKVIAVNGSSKGTGATTKKVKR